MTDADKLRKLKDELGFSYPELADFLGISPKTVYNMLSVGFDRDIPPHLLRLLEYEREVRRLKQQLRHFVRGSLAK